MNVICIEKEKALPSYLNRKSAYIEVLKLNLCRQ